MLTTTPLPIQMRGRWGHTAGTGVAEKAEQERRTLSRRVLLLCRLSRSVLQGRAQRLVVEKAERSVV